MEQKNFTHVRQLLGYGPYGEIELKALVEDLYENAWLPLRNHFTPLMKLIEKIRQGSRVQDIYDKPSSPYQRLLDCQEVEEKTKRELRKQHRQLDPIDLAQAVEEKLAAIFKRVDRIQEERAELRTWAEEESSIETTTPPAADLRGKSLPKDHKNSTNKPSPECHESWRNDPAPPVSFYMAQHADSHATSGIVATPKQIFLPHNQCVALGPQRIKISEIRMMQNHEITLSFPRRDRSRDEAAWIRRSI